LRGKISSIEHAVVLLGTERLRTLVLTCSLVKCVGSFLSPTELQSFWQHSLLTATLSERCALHLHYPEAEEAYLAGLLHDLGVLPLLLLAMRSKPPKRANGTIMWGESPELEQQQVGVDHCVVGKCIGISWNFSREIIDVLEHHHHPHEAQQHNLLVEIVCTADRVCQMHGVKVGGEPPRMAVGDESTYKELLDNCAPNLTEDEKTELAKTLEVEFPEIVDSLGLRVTAARGGAVLPWPAIWG
jgi:HD-like signal output (HDOD) protein